MKTILLFFSLGLSGMLFGQSNLYLENESDCDIELILTSQNPNNCSQSNQAYIYLAAGDVIIRSASKGYEYTTVTIRDGNDDSCTGVALQSTCAHCIVPGTYPTSSIVPICSDCTYEQVTAVWNCTIGSEGIYITN